jgi:hypothetical protein
MFKLFVDHLVSQIVAALNAFLIEELQRLTGKEVQ